MIQLNDGWTFDATLVDGHECHITIQPGENPAVHFEMLQMEYAPDAEPPYVRFAGKTADNKLALYNVEGDNAKPVAESVMALLTPLARPTEDGLADAMDQTIQTIQSILGGDTLRHLN